MRLAPFSFCGYLQVSYIVASGGVTSATYECPTRCNGEKHRYSAETCQFAKVTAADGGLVVGE